MSSPVIGGSSPVTPLAYRNLAANATPTDVQVPSGDQSDMSVAARNVLNGTQLTSPDQENSALQATMHGSTINRATSEQGAFNNFRDAVNSYLSPGTGADPAHQTMATQLTNQLNAYKNSGADETAAMSNLMGTWGSDKMGSLASQAGTKGMPIAGPMANLHQLAAESARYGQ